jgi:hypothetical protein
MGDLYKVLVLSGTLVGRLFAKATLLLPTRVFANDEDANSLSNQEIDHTDARCMHEMINASCPFRRNTFYRATGWENSLHIEKYFIILFVLEREALG